MKKTLLATLIGATVSVSAFAEPTLYGKANVSFQSASEGDADTTQLVSNASRIGVKGNTELENGLTAFYQAEYQTDFDDGDTFSQRNIFVGLKGSFGSVQAGNFDTPLKSAQNKVDLFNDLEGDIKAIVTENDNRVDNIVAYTTPEFSGLTATFAVVASEADGVDDGKSISFNYTRDAIYAAIAIDQDVEDVGVDVTRGVFQYQLGDLQLGALVEQVDADGLDDAFTATFFSAKYKMDKIALKAQIGMGEFYIDATDAIVEDDTSTLSLGADYKLAKNVKTFVYYTANESDDEGIDDTYLGAGIEVKF